MSSGCDVVRWRAVEYFAIDLIMDAEGACVGVLAMCLEDGTLHRYATQSCHILKDTISSWTILTNSSVGQECPIHSDTQVSHVKSTSDLF